MAAAEPQEEQQASYPLQVHYCGVCTMPLEYCEYGGELKKCREWLQTNLPEIYEELTSECPHSFKTLCVYSSYVQVTHTQWHCVSAAARGVSSPAHCIRLECTTPPQRGCTEHEVIDSHVHI